MATYLSTSYTVTSDLLGVQPINLSTTGQNWPLGTKVRAKDPTYGEGTFVYLEGVANTVVGSVVTFDAATGTTVLATTTSGLGPVAVAMSANVASQFGWYQTEGYNPNILANATCVAGSRAYASTTAGEITTSSDSAEGIDGLAVQVSVSAGVAGGTLGSPALNGNS